MADGNGLINGGITARAGLSNGMVNGNGFVNGLSSRKKVNNRRPGVLKALRSCGLRGLVPIVFGALSGAAAAVRHNLSKRTTVSVFLALLLILPVGYLSLPSGSRSSGIVLDGFISDWDGVPRQSLFGTHGSLLESAMKEIDGNLYFYLRVTPSDDDTTVLYGLIDSDGDPGTGYAYGGIGADYLISISVSSRGVSARTASIYGGGAGVQNWSYWSGIGNVAAVAHTGDGASVLEVKIPSYLIGNELSENFRVIWQDRAVLFLADE